METKNTDGHTSLRAWAWHSSAPSPCWWRCSSRRWCRFRHAPCCPPEGWPYCPRSPPQQWRPWDHHHPPFWMRRERSLTNNYHTLNEDDEVVFGDGKLWKMMRGRFVVAITWFLNGESMYWMWMQCRPELYNYAFYQLLDNGIAHWCVCSHRRTTRGKAASSGTGFRVHVWRAATESGFRIAHRRDRPGSIRIQIYRGGAVAARTLWSLAVGMLQDWSCDAGGVGRDWLRAQPGKRPSELRWPRYQTHDSTHEYVGTYARTTAHPSLLLASQQYPSKSNNRTQPKGNICTGYPDKFRSIHKFASFYTFLPLLTISHIRIQLKKSMLLIFYSHGK